MTEWISVSQTEKRFSRIDILRFGRYLLGRGKGDDQWLEMVFNDWHDGAGLPRYRRTHWQPLPKTPTKPKATKWSKRKEK